MARFTVDQHKELALMLPQYVAGYLAPFMASEDSTDETTTTILQSTSREGASEDDRKRRLVELVTKEQQRLTIRADNGSDVLRIIHEGSNAADALGRLDEHLATQAAQDTANLHASKLCRILVDPKMEVFLLGAHGCQAEISCALCASVGDFGAGFKEPWFH